MSNLLPLEWADKKNKPELEAYFKQIDPSYYVLAEEINALRDGINELHSINISASIKTVSLVTPSGVPSDGDEWIIYTE